MDGMSCSLCMFLLFNKEILKFHVPNLGLKTKNQKKFIVTITYFAMAGGE